MPHLGDSLLSDASVANPCAPTYLADDALVPGSAAAAREVGKTTKHAAAAIPLGQVFLLWNPMGALVTRLPPSCNTGAPLYLIIFGNPFVGS
jgi:hypothetical protein